MLHTTFELYNICFPLLIFKKKTIAKDRYVKNPFLSPLSSQVASKRKVFIFSGVVRRASGRRRFPSPLLWFSSLLSGHFPSSIALFRSLACRVSVVRESRARFRRRRLRLGSIWSGDAVACRGF